MKEKAIFASKLAALVDAGVPIVRSLDLMATQQKLPMQVRACTPYVSPKVFRASCIPEHEKS